MKLPRSRKLWLVPAGAVILTFFYPPYSELQSTLGATAFRGYAWILDLPALKVAIVAWPLLLVEWVAIALVSGPIWLAFKE